MNKRKITAKIKNIENIDCVKMSWDDYVRLHLESGKHIDLIPNFTENYQEGDEIEYLVNNKGNLIYENKGIPRYLLNKSLLERLD